MKDTKAELTSLYTWGKTNGEIFERLEFQFDLSEDDLEQVEKKILPALRANTGKELDLADVLFTCLTYGIHKALEGIEGTPFKLRMDRKKNEA